MGRWQLCIYGNSYIKFDLAILSFRSHWKEKKILHYFYNKQRNLRPGNEKQNYILYFYYHQNFLKSNINYSRLLSCAYQQKRFSKENKGIGSYLLYGQISQFPLYILEMNPSIIIVLKRRWVNHIRLSRTKNFTFLFINSLYSCFFLEVYIYAYVPLQM